MLRMKLATALLVAATAPAALAAPAPESAPAPAPAPGVSPEPMEETALATPAAAARRPGSFVQVQAIGVPLGEPGIGDGAGVAEVIVRAVVAPAATVSRELASQPVHPHLIEVRLVNTTVYLDPEVDYRHKRVGSLDEDHFILKAQRVHRANDGATSARVLYGPTEAPAVEEPRPELILHKPTPRPTPQPRPATVATRLASAD